jgi:hypothetical protein
VSLNNTAGNNKFCLSRENCDEVLVAKFVK